MVARDTCSRLEEPEGFSCEELPSEAFEKLEGLMPGVSETDSVKVQEVFDCVDVFPELNQRQKTALRETILEAHCIIPTVKLFTVHMRVFEKIATSMKRILTLSGWRVKRGQGCIEPLERVLKGLYSAERNVSDEYSIQTMHGWRIISSVSFHDRQELSCRQLWLFLLRNIDSTLGDNQLAYEAMRFGFYSDTIAQYAAGYTPPDLNPTAEPDFSQSSSTVPVEKRLGPKAKRWLERSNSAITHLYFDTAESIGTNKGQAAFKLDDFTALIELASIYRAFFAHPALPSKYADPSVAKNEIYPELRVVLHASDESSRTPPISPEGGPVEWIDHDEPDFQASNSPMTPPIQPDEQDGLNIEADDTLGSRIASVDTPEGHCTSNALVQFLPPDDRSAEDVVSTSDGGGSAEPETEDVHVQRLVGSRPFTEPIQEASDRHALEWLDLATRELPQSCQQAAEKTATTCRPLDTSQVFPELPAQSNIVDLRPDSDSDSLGQSPESGFERANESDANSQAGGFDQLTRERWPSSSDLVEDTEGSEKLTSTLTETPRDEPGQEIAERPAVNEDVSRSPIPVEIEEKSHHRPQSQGVDLAGAGHRGSQPTRGIGVSEQTDCASPLHESPSMGSSLGDTQHHDDSKGLFSAEAFGEGGGHEVPSDHFASANGTSESPITVRSRKTQAPGNPTSSNEDALENSRECSLSKDRLSTLNQESEYIDADADTPDPTTGAASGHGRCGHSLQSSESLTAPVTLHVPDAPAGHRVVGQNETNEIVRASLPGSRVQSSSSEGFQSPVPSLDYEGVDLVPPTLANPVDEAAVPVEGPNGRPEPRAPAHHSPVHSLLPCWKGTRYPNSERIKQLHVRFHVDNDEEGREITSHSNWQPPTIEDVVENARSGGGSTGEEPTSSFSARSSEKEVEPVLSPIDTQMADPIEQAETGDLLSVYEGVLQEIESGDQARERRMYTTTATTAQSTQLRDTIRKMVPQPAIGKRKRLDTQGYDPKRSCIESPDEALPVESLLYGHDEMTLYGPQALRHSEELLAFFAKQRASTPGVPVCDPSQEQNIQGMEPSVQAFTPDPVDPTRHAHETDSNRPENTPEPLHSTPATQHHSNSEQHTHLPPGNGEAPFAAVPHHDMPPSDPNPNPVLMDVDPPQWMPEGQTTPRATDNPIARSAQMEANTGPQPPPPIVVDPLMEVPMVQVPTAAPSQDVNQICSSGISPRLGEQTASAEPNLGVEGSSREIESNQLAQESSFNQFRGIHDTLSIDPNYKGTIFRFKSPGALKPKKKRTVSVEDTGQETLRGSRATGRRPAGLRAKGRKATARPNPSIPSGSGAPVSDTALIEPAAALGQFEFVQPATGQYTGTIFRFKGARPKNKRPVDDGDSEQRRAFKQVVQSTLKGSSTMGQRARPRCSNKRRCYGLAINSSLLGDPMSTVALGQAESVQPAARQKRKGLVRVIGRGESKAKNNRLDKLSRDDGFVFIVELKDQNVQCVNRRLRSSIKSFFERHFRRHSKDGTFYDRNLRRVELDPSKSGAISMVDYFVSETVLVFQHGNHTANDEDLIEEISRHVSWKKEQPAPSPKCRIYHTARKNRRVKG